MAIKISFILDQDEREVVDAVYNNEHLLKQKIIKYGLYHGHKLEYKAFEYNPTNGEVIYYE